MYMCETILPGSLKNAMPVTVSHTIKTTFPAAQPARYHLPCHCPEEVFRAVLICKESLHAVFADRKRFLIDFVVQ